MSRHLQLKRKLLDRTDFLFLNSHPSKTKLSAIVNPCPSPLFLLSQLPSTDWRSRPAPRPSTSTQRRSGRSPSRSPPSLARITETSETSSSSRVRSLPFSFSFASADLRWLIFGSHRLRRRQGCHPSRASGEVRRQGVLLPRVFQPRLRPQRPLDL